MPAFPRGAAAWIFPRPSRTPTDLSRIETALPLQAAGMYWLAIPFAQGKLYSSACGNSYFKLTRQFGRLPERLDQDRFGQMLPRNLFVDKYIEEFKAKYGFDPYSRDFIFGSAEENTRLRNQILITGPSGPITMLSEMLRHGLDDTKRDKLFPSKFHLGSSKKIQKDQLTLVKLADHVRIEKRDSQQKKVGKRISRRDNPETLKKEFDSITGTLKRITGRRFGDYEDKQNAIRTIYLVSRMMPSSSHASERRKRRFLTFIKTPIDKFSFEARGSFPTTDSEENTFLLNDLKAYIGIEIENGTQQRIDSIFHSLIGRVNAIRFHLDQVAFSSSQKQRIPSDYRTLHALVAAINVPQPEDPSRKAGRLDYDLYMHLNKFEFLHFSGAYAEILRLAKPPSPIASIQVEMIDALSHLTNEKRNYFQTTLDNFLLTDFPSLANENANLFLNLIEKSLDFRPSDTKYTAAVSLAYELLYRCRLFSSDKPLLRAQVRINFRSIVSALCATSQALENRTDYRPRVYSNNKQPRSIVTPLETFIDLDGDAPPREIPEGYVQLWHHRREWVQYALEGSYEIAELKFGLRKLLLDKFVECVRPNEITLIEQLLSKLEVDLRSVRFVNLGA